MLDGKSKTGLNDSQMDELVKELEKEDFAELSKDFDMHNADFERTGSSYERKEPVVRKLPNVRVAGVKGPYPAETGVGVLMDIIFYGPREQLSMTVDMGRMGREWCIKEGLSGFAINDVSTPIPLNRMEVASEREKATMNMNPNEIYKVKVTLMNNNL